MQIRCYRCGWSFAINKEEAAFALQALEETEGSHYDSNCPRCRHTNRISLEQLKKAAPATGSEPTSAELVEVAEADHEQVAEVRDSEIAPSEAEANSEKTEPKKRKRRRR